MELKDFIKNVLVDISTAIEESQDALSSKACVAPLIAGGNSATAIKTVMGYAKISDIDFDVAVTTETKDGSSSETGGGIKILDVIKFVMQRERGSAQLVAKCFTRPLLYSGCIPTFKA